MLLHACVLCIIRFEPLGLPPSLVKEETGNGEACKQRKKKVAAVLENMPEYYGPSRLVYAAPNL
jgi:hypothetical protein